MKSWWPLHTTWNDPTVGAGRWTQVNEVWFQKRLKDIEKGVAKPLPANKWRDCLKGQKYGRVLLSSIRKFSEQYLDEHRYFA
jgi:hypothetical protein